MKRHGAVGLAALLVFTGAGCSAMRRGPSEETIKKSVTDYLARKANVPPGTALEVKEFKDASVTGAKTGVVEAGGQKVPFTVFDGRYVVYAELEDLTADPFVAVMKKINLEGRPSKGPATAKVTIVEYSDFQCPFCSRGYNTIESQVLKEYGDKVRFYYKSMPLPMHPWAEPAAIASECARQQKPEGFWKLYDFYFQNQREITPANLKAKSLDALKGTGIDEAQFSECLDQKKTLDLVKADAAEAQSLGIQGTPGFVINGRTLKGAYPFEQFKAIIDGELAR